VEIVVGLGELRVLGEHLHQKVGGSSSVGEEKDPSMNRCSTGCPIGRSISRSVGGSILCYGGHSVEWSGMSLQRWRVERVKRVESGSLYM